LFILGITRIVEYAAQQSAHSWKLEGVMNIVNAELCRTGTMWFYLVKNFDNTFNVALVGLWVNTLW